MVVSLTGSLVGIHTKASYQQSWFNNAVYFDIVPDMDLNLCTWLVKGHKFGRMIPGNELKNYIKKQKSLS